VRAPCNEICAIVFTLACLSEKDALDVQYPSQIASSLTHTVPAGQQPEIGMKTVGNDLENLLTIPFPLFFGRERDRERESRTGKRNQYYRISEIEYFDREYVIDRKSVIYNRNTIMTT